MELSIIIVNYNVEFYLEQCLLSVYKALHNVSGEVIVVDNNSVDGSIEMLTEKFPQVTLIANKDNVGFSTANNQGINVSKGKYVLLLNPDTVVEENTFRLTVDFMNENEDAGGLGVKMIDGTGTFLPESKRGLPTPKVAFYKIFWLAKLFSKSKKYGAYHLSFLDKDEIHKVDVLSGAFMLMRKKTLDKVGLLDETFFMYGEDIDLSYRIQLGGYENYYFPKTQIIHYKGESTKKGSLNYVFVFYNAFQDSNLKRNTYTRAIVSVSQSLGIHSCCVLDHHRTYVSCTAFFSATHFVKKLKMAVCNIPFERQSLFSAHTWTQPDKCTCIIKFIRRYVYLKETTLAIAIIQLIITAEILDNHLQYECMPLKNSIFEESSKETPALPQSTWRSTTAFQWSQKGEFNLSRLGYTSGIFT